VAGLTVVGCGRSHELIMRESGLNHQLEQTGADLGNSSAGLRLFQSFDIRLRLLTWTITRTDLRKQFMKWEYSTEMCEASFWGHGGKFDGQKFNDRLRQLGQDCWELVTVLDTNYGGGATRDVVAVFKRPLK